MFKEFSTFFMLCETSVHAGSGESVGYVDLPLQRNVVTELPIIQPSGVKGSIRDYLENIDKNKVKIIFGPEDGSEYSSCISFTEAKILFFPVKSIFGLFAYVTSPIVLNDFYRTLKITNPKVEMLNLDNIQFIDDDKCVTTNINNLIIKKDNNVYLGEFKFEIEERQIKVKIDSDEKDIFEYLKDKIFPNNEEYKYWKENFTKRVVIISDNIFKDMVNLYTEKVTRNKINDDTGVVDEKGGGLWDEENLPSDTILYSSFFLTDPYKKDSELNDANKCFTWINNKLNNKRIQIGGHKTIGKGFVYINFF